MKTYQLFTEQLKTGPQINDYVICKENYQPNEIAFNIKNFIDNNIGQIIYSNYIWYFVKYDVPINLMSFFNQKRIIKNVNVQNTREMRLEEIVFFSPNIEDCEMYLTTKNFNL